MKNISNKTACTV